MKGHLTAASHGDLRCCVKYIGRFSFLFVSSPFFGFCVALQSSYLTDLDRSARWPLVAGDVTAVVLRRVRRQLVGRVLAGPEMRRMVRTDSE